MIYITTVHDQYYPSGGTADWVYVGSDINEAKEALAINDEWGQYACLIKVTDSGAHIIEERGN